MEYLYDKNFLKELFNSRKRTTFARITKLTLDEHPIESIEGKITSGQVNVDGTSAIRRTFSLSMVTQDLDLNSFDWALETKINLEIGLENTVANSSYPKTLWFPQGIFFISSLSTTVSQTNISISLSGKDKMAQLNGEFGGTFEQMTILDQVETKDGREKYPIDKIIYDMLILVGNEKFHNIQLNDLDQEGLKLLNYLGGDPLYIIQSLDETNNLPSSIYNVSWVRNQTDAPINYCPYWINGTNPDTVQWIELSEEEHPISYSRFVENLTDTQTLFRIGREEPYSYFLIYQINTGDIIGYENTPLVYNSDLIANPGETVTAILDKILNMLNQDYEYFYNLEGRFVLQRKKTYTSMSYSPYTFYQDGAILQVVREQEYQDIIENNDFISNISINPGIDKIKNDYIIYGERENGVPIHLRYVLQDKPVSYTSLTNSGVTYTTSLDDFLTKINSNQFGESMSLSETGVIYYEGIRPYLYFSYQRDSDDDFPFEIGSKIKADDLEEGAVITEVSIISSKTEEFTEDELTQDSTHYSKIILKLYLSLSKSLEAGTVLNNLQIEQNLGSKYIYTDWREVLFQMSLDYYNYGNTDDYQTKFKNGKSGYEQYYTDIRGFWPDLYRISYLNKVSYNSETKELIEDYQEIMGWNQTQLLYPETLQFWLDFIDSGELYERFNVKKINSRPLIKNDSKIRVIFEPVIPPLLLYTDEEPADTKGYTPISINKNIYMNLGVAAYPKAALSVMNSELSNSTAYTRSLSFSIVPNYTYEVNKKIKINNETQKLKGEFLITRLSYPLNYNGMLSVQANEMIQALL